jgi:hypothetical protein
MPRSRDNERLFALSIHPNLIRELNIIKDYEIDKYNSVTHLIICLVISHMKKYMESEIYAKFRKKWIKENTQRNKNNNMQNNNRLLSDN